MKDMSTLIRQLEDGFKELNKRFFEGKLPMATITVQRKKGTYGHCKVYKTWTDKAKEGKRREINIDSVGLGRKKEEVFTTLHHEMVHLWNLENNIQDTSRNGYYHNEKFALSCVEHGLEKGVKNKKYGYYAPTAPKETQKFYRTLHLSNLNEIGVIPKKTEDGEGQTETKKGNSVLLICPSCGTKVRATKKGLHIICAECFHQTHSLEKSLFIEK